MNAPSLPHVSMPSLPQVDVHDMTERMQDIASSASARVHDVASSAAERIEKLPDKAVALAGTVIPALRPPPKRSKRPFLLLTVAIVAAVGVAWFMRTRRSSTTDISDSTTAATNGPRTVSAAS